MARGEVGGAWCCLLGNVRLGGFINDLSLRPSTWLSGNAPAYLHLHAHECTLLLSRRLQGVFRFFFYIFTVVVVACGAVVNVAHVVYVTFLIPTLQRRTFSTINAHLSYTCINCRAARPDQRSRPKAKQQDRLGEYQTNLITQYSRCSHMCVCVCTQSIAYEALNLTQLLCLCRLCLCLSSCHIL